MGTILRTKVQISHSNNNLTQKIIKTKGIIDRKALKTLKLVKLIFTPPYKKNHRRSLLC